MAKSKAKRKSKGARGGRTGETRRSSREEIAERLLESLGQNKEALRYVALFLALCLGFYLIYYILTMSGSVLMICLREFTASVLGFIFSAAGAKVVVNGALVSIDGFGLEIIDECTAVFASIVYCACILVYPTTLRKKGIGVALGLPALYAINIFRLVILVQVGLSQPALFEFVHVYLWQATFIIFVVVLFLLWLRVVER